MNPDIISNLVRNTRPAADIVEKLASRVNLRNSNQSQIQWASKTHHQRQETARLYIPKVVADQVWAQSTNKTEIRYHQTNICTTHNTELTPAHLRECQNFAGIEDMTDLVSRLKQSNIREWKHPDILRGIMNAVKMTCRLHQLKQSGQVINI